MVIELSTTLLSLFEPFVKLRIEMDVTLPRTVLSLLVVAGIAAFYIPFFTQQSDAYKAVGITLAVILWTVSTTLWYWDRKRIHDHKRFEV